MAARYFSLREFECRCCRRVKLATRLVLLLDDMRARLGRPVLITSGYRCLKHNERAGGAKASLHLNGQAADISATASEQAELAGIARVLGFEEIILGGTKNYLHVGVKTLTM